MGSASMVSALAADPKKAAQMLETLAPEVGPPSFQGLGTENAAAWCASFQPGN